MTRMYSYLLAALLATVSVAALAADDASKALDPRVAIAKKFPGVNPEDIRTAPISGLYEVPIGADIAYVTADAHYILAGDLYEIDTRRNLTEAGRSSARGKLLAKIDERDMIVFTPPVVKYTINVFTDVECGYCRKLHSQMDQLAKLGVQVRYLAYPRAGPNTDDWHKMEAVWCAKDRKTAITQAKLGQQVEAKSCGATPIGKQYQLGEDLGVRGTPAIFTNRGDYISGYLPPDELVKELEKFEKSKGS